jgi:Ca2+-binding EF-hand superfamily protein
MEVMADTGKTSAVQEFERMDTDDDGCVDRTDYLRTPLQILARLGVSEHSTKGRAFLDANHTQWEALLALDGTTSDKMLTFDEYLARRSSAEFRSPDRPGKGEVSRALFNLIDTDDDGGISVAEFLHAAAFLCMPDQDALDYFGQQDTDDNGRLDRAEFLGAVKLFYSA